MVMMVVTQLLKVVITVVMTNVMRSRHSICDLWQMLMAKLMMTVADVSCARHMLTL